MDIIFYKLQDEVNDVKKLRTLTATATYEPMTVQGSLKAPTSKIAPVIEFGQDITYFNGYNYCYIADFNRYYFVEDMVSIRTSVTSISLRVDVLTSFLTQANMGNLEGFVVRCSNSSIYDSYIPDRQVQFKIDPKYTIYEPTSVSQNINIENITFDVSTNLEKNVVISTYNNEGKSPLDPQVTFTNISIPNILAPLTKTTTVLGDFTQPSGNCVPYVTNSYGRTIYSLFASLNLNASDEGFIYNVMAFPFNIPNRTYNEAYHLTLNGQAIPNFYDHDTQPDIDYCPVDVVLNSNSGYLVLKDFVLTLPNDYNNSNFIDYDPYTKVEIFIPFASWISINVKENIGCRLQVIYNVDYITGSSAVILYNSTKGIILYENVVQIGVQYPTSTTNAKELLVQGQNYARNFALGAMGSVGMTLLGLATYNGGLIAGGILGGMKTVNSVINNYESMIPKGNAQIANASALTGVFGGLKVLVKITQSIPINFTSANKNDFIKHLGVPSNTLHLLSELVDSNVYHTYVEIIDLHTSSEAGSSGSLYSITDITLNEIEEIKKLCNEGIYI